MRECDNSKIHISNNSVLSICKVMYFCKNFQGICYEGLLFKFVTTF